MASLVMSVDLYQFPNVQYDEYHEWIIYGYDFSSNLLKSLDPSTINEFEMFTKFDCIEDKTI